MSALVYALALFGCSDDAAICERLSDKAQMFQSRVQCEMAIDAAFELPIVRKADYPTVVGRCMDQGHWAKSEGRTMDLSERETRLASTPENKTRS